MCENKLEVGQLRKLDPSGVPCEVIALGERLAIMKYTPNGGEFSEKIAEVSRWSICGKYDDFKIDDPVMYKYATSGIKDWCHGHFAGTNGFDEPMVFEDGRTSFTACGETETVRDVRHPTKEELLDE